MRRIDAPPATFPGHHPSRLGNPGRPVLRAVRPGPFATSQRVLHAESDDVARARLEATVVNSAYRAAMHTAASVPQPSLREFLR